jgi:hypothetical protein
MWITDSTVQRLAAVD